MAWAAASSAEERRSSRKFAIVLVGDAGDSRPGILSFIRSEANKRSDTLILFMGDNIYPAGLPDEGRASYPTARGLLLQQIEAIRGIRGRAVFIPGNHDWNDSKEGGLGRIKNQQAFVESELGARSFAPRNGCPGPHVIVDRKEALVVALDTEWWLHEFDKPDGPEDGCPTYTQAGVERRLRRLAARTRPGQAFIIAQHHPIKSVGAHFGAAKCPQDAGCWSYAAMRTALQRAMEANPALVCAAGHDHSLQVLGPVKGCRHVVVSGSGSYTSAVGSGEGVKIALKANGLVRIDFRPTRVPVLSVLTIDDQDAVVLRHRQPLRGLASRRRLRRSP